jgi:hypothetical protein
MNVAIVSTLVVASALVIAQQARAESPAHCAPGYVRSVPGGPCHLDVLATNKFKAKTAAPRRQRR